MDAGVNGWMSASKHHGQPFVGDLGFGERIGQHIGDSLQGDFLQIVGFDLTSALSAEDIDHFTASDSQQPSFWICRAAVARPTGQRRCEGL